MSVLTSSRIGSSISSALGLDPVSVAQRKSERIYKMEILPGKHHLKGNRVHAAGDIVEVNETTARDLFAAKVATAVNPGDFDPPLSMPKKIEPKNRPALLPGESEVEVKVKRVTGFYFGGRTYLKGDTFKLPETHAAHGIRGDSLEFAKGAGFSERGKVFLAALRKGVTNPEF